MKKQNQQIGLVSKKFWISFFDFYYKLFVKYTGKFIKKAHSGIFYYSFDVSLAFGKKDIF